jgi:hypothetical protein
VSFEHGKHQDAVRGVAADGQQPEHDSGGQQHAVRSDRGEMIRRRHKGLDERHATDADDHARQV